MKLCVLLVLFSFCYCSKNEVMPVSYESKVAEYENYESHLDSKGEYGRNEDNIRDSQSDFNEDMKKIDEYYTKYIRSQRSESKHEDKNYSGVERNNNEEMKARLDDIFGYTGPTANDEPENIMRPCALDDWQCIRKYFAANGNCKPVYGPIPDPLYIDINTVFVTNANLTITLSNLVVRGLSSAKISEFYVNRKTGNLVVAIEVQNLNETSPRAYFRYRRTAKESIILAGYLTINFRALTATVVIPKVPHLRLDLADVHGDIQEALPQFFIAPEAALSEDPDVVSAFAQFLANLPISIREAALFQAQLYSAIYIQKNICDFGLKLISV